MSGDGAKSMKHKTNARASLYEFETAPEYRLTIKEQQIKQKGLVRSKTYDITKAVRNARPASYPTVYDKSQLDEVLRPRTEPYRKKLLGAMQITVQPITSPDIKMPRHHISTRGDLVRTVNHAASMLTPLETNVEQFTTKHAQTWPKINISTKTVVNKSPAVRQTESLPKATTQTHTVDIQVDQSPIVCQTEPPSDATTQTQTADIPQPEEEKVGQLTPKQNQTDTVPKGTVPNTNILTQSPVDENPAVCQTEPTPKATTQIQTVDIQVKSTQCQTDQLIQASTQNPVHTASQTDRNDIVVPRMGPVVSDTVAEEPAVDDEEQTNCYVYTVRLETSGDNEVLPRQVQITLATDDKTGTKCVFKANTTRETEVENTSLVSIDSFKTCLVKLLEKPPKDGDWYLERIMIFKEDMNKPKNQECVMSAMCDRWVNSLSKTAKTGSCSHPKQIHEDITMCNCKITVSLDDGDIGEGLAIGEFDITKPQPLTKGMEGHNEPNTTCEEYETICNILKDQSTRAPFEQKQDLCISCVDKPYIGDHVKPLTNKWTLLHHACAQNRADIVTFLLESGADGNRPAASGSNPIQIAAQNGALEVLEVFLTQTLKQKQPIAMNKPAAFDGQVLLHYACMSAKEDILDMLLKDGRFQKTLSVADILGHTPRDVALMYGHRKHVEILDSYGKCIK